MDRQPSPREGTTSLHAEHISSLRRTFRFHHYPRFTDYASPDLVLRGHTATGMGTIGWMTVRNAVVLIEPGADGVVFVDRHTVLRGSTLQRRPVLSRPGVQTTQHVLPHPETVTELDQEVAVVFRPGWHNYFHWMVQYLPMALHSRETQPHVEVVLPKYDSFADRPLKPTFSEDTYRTSLELVVGQGPPVRFLDPGYYRFPTVHLPMFHRPTIFGHGFRDRFFDRLEPLLTPGRSNRPVDRRLFITRAGALNRGRVDEKVHRRMACLAREAGFESIDLAAMPWTEQVETFASASTILAVHGAGLANIVFSQGATVIEYNQLVRDETSLRDVYFGLCRDLGHRYLLIRDVDLDHIGPEHLTDSQDRTTAPVSDQRAPAVGADR